MFRDNDSREPQSVVHRGMDYRILVLALAAAVLLQWIGSSAVLPLLPLYLADQGNPSGLIGAVMASFFAAGVIAQYTGGRLGDRIGHRGVLLAGLAGYALSSAAFLLPVDGWGYLILRSAQGAGAGAAQVACLALAAQAVPADTRGRAYAAISAAELGGVALGPMVGAAVGIAHMGTLFVIASVAAALAALPVLALRPTANAAAPTMSEAGAEAGIEVGTVPDADPAGARNWLPDNAIARRVLAGVFLVAVIGGLLTGVYEACWSLLMHARGATDRQIGLSWTLFALPFILVAPLAGWLADRADRRVLVIGGVLTGAVSAMIYPFLPSVTWLLALGAVESAGFVFAVPAAQSLLTEQIRPDAVGRAQGTFVALQTAAIAGSAALCGAAFAVRDWLPFVAAGAVATTLLLPVLHLWHPRTPRDHAEIDSNKCMITTGG